MLRLWTTRNDNFTGVIRYKIQDFTRTSHWKYKKFSFTKIAGGVIYFSKYMHHTPYMLHLYSAVHVKLVYKLIKV